MKHISYPTKQAIENLINKLHLPRLDEFTQDWEYEVTNINRIEEFIEFYKHERLSEAEKFTLMIIIIGSCNDAIENKCFNIDLWEQIQTLLINDLDIHINTINYWSCGKEPLEDTYYITSFIRSLKVFTK